jgi:hypothetical protein
MLLFRQKFFKLQRELLEDKEIRYFESEGASQLQDMVNARLRRLTELLDIYREVAGGKARQVMDQLAYES